MHRERLTFTLLLLSAAALYAQEAPPPPESVAKPSQLSISCTIDTAARTAHVVIANRTGERSAFQMVVGPGFNYKVEVTGKGGVRLPQRDFAPKSQGQALTVSLTQVNLAPKAQ